MEGLCGAIVKQVGGFESIQAWTAFPFKGKGGVGLDNADNIHQLPGVAVADFNKGYIWWALLEFPY